MSRLHSSRRSLAVALLTLAFAGCASGPKRPAMLPRGDYGFLRERIDWLARREMREHDLPGLSVVVVDGQRIVMAKGFGFADRDAGIRATPDTVYRVGSISKLLTASAVMKLHGSGRLDIDLPLERYLKTFSMRTRFPKAIAITPRHLLTHRSGLPSDFLSGMMTKRPVSGAQLLERIRDEYVANPPEHTIAYSNLGFELLGYMVEEVAGEPFASYVERELLQPMGMTRSSFSLTPDVERHLARGYVDGEVGEQLPMRPLAAGGLYASARDLARFLATVFDGGRAGATQVLRPQTVRELLAEQESSPLDLDARMGLGWHLDFPGSGLAYAGRLVGHDGGTLLFSSLLLALPEHELGVVVLTNTISGAESLRRIALEALEIAFQTKSGITPPPTARATDVRTVALTPEQARGTSGAYATLGAMILIEPDGSRLRARLKEASREQRVRLLPQSNGRFRPQLKLLGLIPITMKDLEISFADVDGEKLLVAHAPDGSRQRVATRIAPRSVPRAWQNRTGAYRVANRPENEAVMLDDFRLFESDGFLYFSCTDFEGQSILAPLGAVNDEEAVLVGLGRYLGETIRAVRVDGRDYLRYSGYVLAPLASRVPSR